MLYRHYIMQEDMLQLAKIEYIPYKKLNNKTVLVTGAAGMLAYYMVCFLMYLNQKEDYNINIIAIVRDEEKGKECFEEFLLDEKFKLLVQDVTKKVRIEEPIHFIVHAAGNSSPYAIMNNPVDIIKTNVIGTSNIMELARGSSLVENVLFLSTREVYGKITDRDRITEEDMGILDPVDQRSCYPESKRMAEQILMSYHLMYDIPIKIARIAHVFGPGMRLYKDGRVMADFICDRVENRNIVLKSSGEAIRAFCYVTDAVAALFAIMLYDSEEFVYNVANETEQITVRETAEKVAAVRGETEIQVIYEKHNNNNNGYCQYKRVRLETGRLRKLGWIPQISLDEGIYRTIQSFR